MLISEIFYSIQGEGILTGVPSVFIRTSGCNLRCRWCDTPYASWEPEGEELSVAEITGRLEAWPSATHVVLTGGEPMVARIAKGAAATALGMLDQPGSQFVRNAADTALSGDGPRGSGTEQNLLLDAGIDFDVFVQVAF